MAIDANTFTLRRIVQGIGSVLERWVTSELAAGAFIVSGAAVIAGLTTRNLPWSLAGVAVGLVGGYLAWNGVRERWPRWAVCAGVLIALALDVVFIVAVTARS